MMIDYVHHDIDDLARSIALHFAGVVLKLVEFHNLVDKTFTDHWTYLMSPAKEKVAFSLQETLLDVRKAMSRVEVTNRIEISANFSDFTFNGASRI